MAESRVVRAVAAFIALVAWIVPRDQRDAWRDEWTAELWHFITGNEQRRYVAVAWRAAGAVRHAIWIRRTEWRWDMISQDLAYAIRGSLRHPAFAALVIATLGLGIGLNSAMFTIVNSVLIQPLPYPRSNELVYMFGAFSQGNRASISPPDFLDYRAANTVFSSFAAAGAFFGNANITGDGEPERVSATDVTANFFATLAVAPVRGRAFLPEEEEGGGHDVIVISYGFWQRRFGGVANIVGRRITVDGRSSEIVGVMPELLDRTLLVQVWKPIQFHTPETSTRRFHFLRAIGRLKPGMSIAQAQSAMDVAAKQIEATHVEDKTWRLSLQPYRDIVIGNVARPLIVLLGAVSVVLLIACGNVAALLLARVSARRAEIAIRTALGASRTRLVRQLLTESMLLALAGGGVGLGLAKLLVTGVRGVGQGIVPRLAEVAIDPAVFSFTFALSLVTGVVFGVAPALNSVRGDLTAAVAALGRASETRHTARARDALVVAQVALSLVLLVGAGLLLKSLWRLQHVEPGFDASNVLTASITLPESRYADRGSRLAFWQNLTDRARALPGVRTASLTSMLPLRGGGDTRYAIEGQPPVSDADARFAQIAVVGDDYFETMRIRVVSGRGFTAADRTGPNAIILSAGMAARLFSGESALGKRLVVDFGKPFTGEIVGVAGDVNAFGLANDPPDVLYFSIHQPGGFARIFMNVVVRTASNAAGSSAGLRAAVASIDHDLPLAGLTTMEQLVSLSTSRERFSAQLFAALAIAALLLAVVGLYGVLSYLVAQRTRELGVRIALGAGGGAIMRLVVGRAMGIVALGLALGLGGSLLLTRFVDRLLFQVGRNDPAVLIGVPLVLVAAGLVAAALPARRATRVDPLTALRTM